MTNDYIGNHILYRWHACCMLHTVYVVFHGTVHQYPHQGVLCIWFTQGSSLNNLVGFGLNAPNIPRDVRHSTTFQARKNSARRSWSWISVGSMRISKFDKCTAQILFVWSCTAWWLLFWPVAMDPNGFSNKKWHPRNRATMKRRTTWVGLSKSHLRSQVFHMKQIYYLFQHVMVHPFLFGHTRKSGLSPWLGSPCNWLPGCTAGTSKSPCWSVYNVDPAIYLASRRSTLRSSNSVRI